MTEQVARPKPVMRPYSIYLPEEYIIKIKEYAKERKAASIVRDALIAALEGGGEWNAGYNKGLRDAIKLINECREIDVIAIRGKYLSDLLSDQLRQIMVSE